MTTEELRVAMKTVDTMSQNGDLAADGYYKCLVTLAARWLCEHHDAEQALILLNRCSPDYLQAVLCDQMAADDDFAALVAEFGYRLVQLGLADVDVQPPTMPPGSA